MSKISEKVDSQVHKIHKIYYHLNFIKGNMKAVFIKINIHKIMNDLRLTFTNNKQK